MGEYPSVIKINGKAVGKVIDFPLKLNADNFDFFEICPICEKENNLNFILDFSHPFSSNKVTFIDLKNAYSFYYFSSNFEEKTLIYHQLKSENALITVYCDNQNKLCIETEKDFLIENLSLKTERAEIKLFGNTHAIILLYGKENTIFIYSLFPIKKVYQTTFFNVEISDEIKITKVYKDVLKHVETFNISLENEEIKITNRSLTTKKPYVEKLFLPEIIPYIFLEELLLSGDLTPYLSQSMIENQDRLKEYFGNFLSIIPPKDRTETEIGLLYYRENNSYFVEYFTFDLEDNKIVNIKKSAE